MRLVAGLGNPGSNYRRNRHNIGFLVLDALAQEHNRSFKKAKLYDWYKIDDVLFIKPKTYMNRSGEAVLSALTSEHIEDIVVICDDIHIPFGEIRIREKGGYGGHNGLRSIGDTLGSKDFSRMRIGVDSPEGENWANYVLSNFSKQEELKLGSLLEMTNKLLGVYIDAGFKAMLDHFSSEKKSYSESIGLSESKDQRRENEKIRKHGNNNTID
jgi:PTH1 family peptidyl-tRNA hydrolase